MCAKFNIIIVRSNGIACQNIFQKHIRGKKQHFDCAGGWWWWNKIESATKTTLHELPLSAIIILFSSTNRKYNIMRVFISSFFFGTFTYSSASHKSLAHKRLQHMRRRRRFLLFACLNSYKLLFMFFCCYI